MDDERDDTTQPGVPSEPVDEGTSIADTPITTPEPDVTAQRPDPSEISFKKPLLALLVPIAVLALGSVLLPRLVWDQFVYKYYWNPIVVDAGFNVVNTITWAYLMGAILFLLWRTVQKIEQPITFAVILAVVPYIMAGSVTRVLEDTGYFVTPLRYLFITPIIYVVIVAVAAFWLVTGHLLHRHSREVGLQGALIAFGAFLGTVWILFTFWGFYGDELARYPHPLVTFLALAVPYAYFWNYTKQRGTFSQNGVMATVGTAYLIVMAYMVVLWHSGQQWGSLVDCAVKDGPCRVGFGADLRPFVYVVMVIAPAVLTALVYYVAKWRLGKVDTGSETWQHILVFLLPINLLIVFAQTMDASMTSLGIDFYNYAEKHVLPAFLIEWMAQNGPGIFGRYPATFVMMTVKFAVALLVVYAIDVYAKKDMEQYPDLVALAKLAIIMVGLAPGTRDAVRLAMDV